MSRRIKREGRDPEFREVEESEFDGLDEDRKRLAIERLAAQTEAARRDPKHFFSFVMKEERTQKPLICQPHQRVLFDFIMAHRLCVVRMPVGTSKTISSATIALYLLGKDSTERGAIVSETQQQAIKPMTMVRDYIESSAELKMVFPGLKRSKRLADAWTQTALTVDRPPGIRDASLVAAGIDGAIAGARLSWIVIDDILSRVNTSTPAGRTKVHEFVDSTVLSRLDPETGRCVVTNTPWSPDDLTYRLEAAGWPTLTMDVMGGVHLSNVGPEWDSTDIRPSKRLGEWYRLSAHDVPIPDQDETKVLFPLRYSRTEIDTIKARTLPHRFQQAYMSQCRDDENSKCKVDWIEKCKVRGLSMVSQHRTSNLVVTGVDLAVGQESIHDKTAFFTVEALPSGKRRILDVEEGRYDAPTIVKKIIEKQRAYNSIIRVENVAAQDYLRQFVRQADASIPIKAHTTGRNKAHPEYGVEAIFISLMNGAWEIPCDTNGHVHRYIQAWVDGCLYYENGKHIADLLMACWFACEQIRHIIGSGGRKGPQHSGSVASNLMAR